MNLLDLRASDRAELLDVLEEVSGDLRGEVLERAHAAAAALLKDARERVERAFPVPGVTLSEEVRADLLRGLLDEVPEALEMGEDAGDDDAWDLGRRLLAGLSDRGWTLTPRSRPARIRSRVYPRVKRLRR